MVTLTDKQITALSRLNREYNIAKMELANNGDDGELTVKFYVRAGKEIKLKGLHLSADGSLAGIMKNENSTTNT